MKDIHHAAIDSLPMFEAEDHMIVTLRRLE
jgi:hypothetical protein